VHDEADDGSKEDEGDGGSPTWRRMLGVVFGLLTYVEKDKMDGRHERNLMFDCNDYNHVMVRKT